MNPRPLECDSSALPLSYAPTQWRIYFSTPHRQCYRQHAIAKLYLQAKLFADAKGATDVVGALGWSLGLSGALTALLTWLFLPRLRQLKGETVREDVPERHRLKAGTPTMGGLAFVLAVPLTLSVVATLNLAPLSLADALLLSGAMLSFAAIGWGDDWAKLRRKKGWRTQPKLAAQVLLTLVWLGAAWSQWRLADLLPVKTPTTQALWFVFLVLLFLATVNGVNIADGLDGLAAGLTAIAAGAVSAFAFLNERSDAAFLAAALVGGCLGFLVFNRYPAKVFMGDIGSMALGAGLAMAVLKAHAVFPFLLIGLVFWIEQATVTVQVAYFKWTKRRYGEGRRIFPMTPIHHSFELWGWHEPAIVGLFWLAGLVAALLAFALQFALS